MYCPSSPYFALASTMRKENCWDRGSFHSTTSNRDSGNSEVCFLINPLLTKQWLCRHISLKTEGNFPMSLPMLFVNFETKIYVPDGLGGNWDLRGSLFNWKRIRFRNCLFFVVSANLAFAIRVMTHVSNRLLQNLLTFQNCKFSPIRWDFESESEKKYGNLCTTVTPIFQLHFYEWK